MITLYYGPKYNYSWTALIMAGQNLTLQNHDGTAQPVLDGHQVTQDTRLIQNRVVYSAYFIQGN